jgi:hypothetical protein
MTPTDPQPRRDQDDRAVIRRAATWLRDHPGQATALGITTATDARALAVVLDILADEVPNLDAELRRETLRSCRSMLGETG